MSEVVAHYQKMWDHACVRFQRNEFELDPLIGSNNDTRRGLTCIARLDANVKAKVQSFIDEAKQLFPNQYFYPLTDLHLTIMSIISCEQHFVLSSIDEAEYIAILEEIATQIHPFKVIFKGITASPSCILLQGIVESNQLQLMRNLIRDKFKNSPLKHSIDTRYPITTAHCTIMRFKAPVANPQKLVAFLNQYRAFDFGITNVSSVKLVFNDWYQTQRLTKKLFKTALTY